MNDNAAPNDWHRATHVSFGELCRKLDGATLREQNTIIEFIRAHPHRIRPRPDDDWLYDTASGYFLNCIARESECDADDEFVHTPFEAAHELVEWFNWIVARDDSPKAVYGRTERISAAYKNGNTLVRNCIETGFLEHVLEVPSNRPFFQHWKDDVMPAEGFSDALKWGEAHTKGGAP